MQQNLRMDKETIDMVWNRADAESAPNPDFMRKDPEGHWICYRDYEKPDGQYSWTLEIDVDSGTALRAVKTTEGDAGIYKWWHRLCR